MIPFCHAPCPLLRPSSLRNWKTKGRPQTHKLTCILSVFSIIVMALRPYQSEVCFTHLFLTLFSKVSGDSGPRPATIFSKSPIKLYFLE